MLVRFPSLVKFCFSAASLCYPVSLSHDKLSRWPEEVLQKDSCNLGKYYSKESCS